MTKSFLELVCEPYAHRGRGLLLFAFCILATQMVQAQAWFDSNWPYRKAIIIDQSKVIGGPHTDFPLLIQITDDGLKNYAQNNGNDILFTASDGVTQLDHDIERFIGSSGALTAWVRIPSLGSGSNTVLYMYYGNASASNQANITGTWSSSFESVYHFDNNLRDRTSNAHNLSNYGTTNNNSGMFSRARTYNPSSGSSYTNVSGLMGNPSSITLSGWAYVNSFSSGGGELISLGDHVAIRLQSGGTTGFFYNGSSWYNTTYNTGYSGAWHYYCYTVDGVGYSQNLYVDGAQVASNSFSSSISYSGLGSKTVIGRHGNGSTNFDLGAVIDEMRVASVARSAGWIQTEFNNQSAPGSFYALGDCESQQATVTSPVAYCRFASATQLSASGNSLLWSLGTVTGSCGGSSTLSTSTWVDASSNNQKTQFSTLTGNVLIKSVDFYIPAWQTVNGVQLALFNSSGTAIALSSSFITQSTSSSSLKVTANFNALLSSAGSYSIGLYAGSGNFGGDVPSFPINESTGTLRVTGKSSSYRCFNNIQFDAGGSSSAPTPSTSLPGSTNYLVLSSLNGCVSTYSSIAVNVTDTVGTPVFTLGSSSSRCKMAGTVSYAAAATNNSGITYALDASSLAAGNSINTSTGLVSYVAGWTGTSTITATASGCGSNKSASHVATTSALTVSTTTTRTCVGGSSGTISITAGGGIAPYTYSLNGGSYQASNLFSGLASGSYTINITGSTGCLGSGSASIAPYDTSNDAQDSSGTNTWVGHGYDGTSFNSYYGRFFEAELFNESFGGSTNCFALRSGNDTSYLYTETFTARLRMNSSRRGLYAVNMGSDDGSRLTVDSVMVYNNWTAQAFSWKNNVLIPLTGTSKLLLEYYENSGGNQVAFSGLQLLVADTLSANTIQSICTGNSGLAISGDAIGSLPSGISKSGTGYQWTYSSSLNGSRTNISGATSASFTPSTLSAPFNTPGTYYVFRKVSLVSTNNVAPSSYTGTLESGAAVITVNAAPTASISYSGSPYCSNAGTASVSRSGTAGGTYSAGAGLSINASTGAINLSASTAGSYTVTYTVAASGGCALYQCTTTVQITAAPSASISYPGNPFSNSGTANVSLSGTTGGTFSAGAGLSINATTGTINLSASTPGSYTVTYTISASGGCSTFSTTASVSISAHYIFRSVSNGAWNQSSTWEVSQNSGLSWVPSGTVPTSPGDTVFIAANDTVTVPLNVSASLLRVYATGMLWPAPNVTISGSGMLEGSGNLRVTATGNSSGDFAAQYPISGKTLTNLTLEFAGSSLQKMDAASFAKVRLNNASGIQLSGSASVDSSLSFINGLLLLGNFNLSLGKNISILGSPSAASMIVTDGSGALRMLMSANGTCHFPIGDHAGSAEYSPAHITVSGGSFSAGAYLSIRVTDAKHVENKSISDYLSRYWTLDQYGISGSFSAILHYLPSDVAGSESNIYCSRYVSGSPGYWQVQNPVSTSDTSLHTAVYNGTAVFTGTDRSGGIHNFRSRQNGNWSDSTSWEASIDGGTSWFRPASFPATVQDTVRVLNTNNIIGDFNAAPKLFTVDSGGAYTPNATTIISGSGQMLGSGTLYVTRTTGSNPFDNQYSILSKDVSAMTVAYSAASSQDISPVTYGNLILSGPAQKSLQSGITSTTNLTISTGTTFLLNGTIQIAGSISNNGTFDAHSGSVVMNGSSAQTIPTGCFSSHLIQSLYVNNFSGLSLYDTLLLTGILKVTQGSFSTNNLLTLVSNASGTALVDGSGNGPVTGRVTMQRYLPSGFGYRYISSPFTAAHVAELNDDMNLADSFATLYSYDENVNHAGWLKFTDTSKILTPLSGYAANFGALSVPKTINMSGTLNDGLLAATLYNHNQTYTLGFNLVGNPYPSPIDWNSSIGWTKTNLDDALYFFDNGSTDRYQGAYCSYVNGVSSNGVASNIIASMQGFFVHVSNGSYPVTATLGMTNAVRVNNLLPVFHKQAQSENPLLRLSAGFRDADSFSDPIVVYFNADAHMGFERDKDAVKMFNTDSRLPNLYSVTEDKKLVINAQPLPDEDTRSVPLGLSLDHNGEIEFRMRDAENIPLGLHLYFADAARGIIQDLDQQPTYTIQLAKGNYENRFYLLYSRLLHPSIPGQETLELTIQGNTIIVTQHEQQGNFILRNMLGQVVLQQSLQGAGKHAISVHAAPGVYVASLTTTQGTKSRKLALAGQ